MSGKTFQDRLRGVLAAGNLTLSDLARWFDRPRPTVKTWADEGREPSGPPLDVEHAHAMLGLLEQMIKRRQGFPVPIGLSSQKRMQHLQAIRKRVLP